MTEPTKLQTALPARALNQMSTWLQKPTFALLGKPQEEPILTAKEIFALHYSSDALEKQPDLAAKVQKIKLQKRWASAAKVIWVVSFILPLLYYLGSLCRKLASLDPIIRETTLQMDVVPLQKAQLQALRDSVKEFIEILENVGCKQEREDTSTKYDWINGDIRQIALRKFINQFKSSKELLHALSEISQSLLGLFAQVADLKDLKLKTFDDSSHTKFYAITESDAVLLNNMAYFINRFQWGSNDGQQVAIRYLCGDEAFHQCGWEYLTSRKERFIAICNQRLKDTNNYPNPDTIAIKNSFTIPQFPTQIVLKESEAITCRTWNELYQDAIKKPIPVWMIAIAQVKGCGYKIYDGVAFTKYLKDKLNEQHFDGNDYHRLINVKNSAIELNSLNEQHSIHIPDLETRADVERVYLFSIDCFKIINYEQHPVDISSVTFRPFFPTKIVDGDPKQINDLVRYAIDSVNYEAQNLSQFFGTQYIVGDVLDKLGKTKKAWKWMLTSCDKIIESDDWVRSKKSPTRM